MARPQTGLKFTHLLLLAGAPACIAFVQAQETGQAPYTFRIETLKGLTRGDGVRYVGTGDSSNANTKDYQYNKTAGNSVNLSGAYHW